MAPRRAAPAKDHEAPTGRPSRSGAASRAPNTQQQQPKREQQQRRRGKAAVVAEQTSNPDTDPSSSSDSDDIQEVNPTEAREQEEEKDVRQQQTRLTRVTRLRPAAVHVAAKGPEQLPRPAAAQVRGRGAARRKAAAATAVGTKAAATVPAPPPPPPPPSRSSRSSQRDAAGNQSSKATEHICRGGGERDTDEEKEEEEKEEEEDNERDSSENSDEADEGEEDEEEEEEEELPVDEEEAKKEEGKLVFGGRGGGKGKGKQPLGAPTSAESRKRLFELLERRVGAAVAASDGSGGGLTRYGNLPVKNSNKKSKLLEDLRSQFDDWHSRLRSNFSVLLHGFGSKRGLLDEFARLLAGPRNRGDAAVLVFRGYDARCTVREVVTGVAGALMNRNFGRTAATATATGAEAEAGAGAAASWGPAAAGGGAGSLAALRALVADIRNEPPNRHVFLVVHNIDGPGLRSGVSLLSELAACPQVHVTASIDHAMAPLLWDSGDAARFRWQFVNATTYLPYIAETSKASPLLLDVFKSGVVTAGAGTVLRSLVLGAQEVFKVLAEHLLEDEECEGVAFAHLFRMCKERYLVRDEGVLRQHLVEFVDHQLLRVRPASDSSGELLTIPMSRVDMQAVLDDLLAARAE